MHVDEGALQAVVARFAPGDLESLSARAACTLIVAEMPGLFGAGGAGLLLVDDYQVLRYVASSDSGAQLLEAIQESTGRGPCVQSLVEDSPVAVDDFDTDARWPDLAEVLVGNGIHAVLGLPVHVHGVTVGSLNVYAAAPRRWDASDWQALLAVDAIVERVLSGALATDRRDDVVDQLQHALESRVAVERAVGVLMAVEDLDAPSAFERIRRAARSARRSVQEVASEVLSSKKLA